MKRIPIGVSDIAQALTHAPPTPPCFPDRMQWAAYLLQCQQASSKSPDQQPFDGYVYKPAFNFCSDCSGAHMQAMAARGRCKPEHLKALVSERA